MLFMHILHCIISCKFVLIPPNDNCTGVSAVSAFLQNIFTFPVHLLEELCLRIVPSCMMQLCNVRQRKPVFCALTLSVICFEIFMVTELSALFLGRQLHQMNCKIQLFGDQLHLHCQGDVKRLCTQLLVLSHLPDDGDEVGLQNVDFYNSSVVAGSLRRLYRTLSAICYV